ncbi:MAG: UDP-N-acetylmuramoyl-tripeptide--D-alanyl-D-alanine ligase [Bacteroidaceae bacterium]
MWSEKLYDIFKECREVTTDSRDCPKGSMFFALKGETFDGNKFAKAALAKGCAYAVIDEKEYVVEGDTRYILVEDVLTALQTLAHRHRQAFKGPVIQITGTNGKTTTKELVSAVLSKKYNVLFTQGNFNNHIGVPKTLLRLNESHDIAVIETGANHPGEIKTLADIVCPDCGLITNVGVAHIEGFGSFEGVMKTKGELYDKLRHKKDGFIFLNGDNNYLCDMAEGLKAYTYGKPGHNYMVEGEPTGGASFLSLWWQSNKGDNERHEVETHLVGAYNIDNVLAAVCVGLKFGVAPGDIDCALREYVPTNNRSEMRETANNTLIIDAYNANPSSMKAALENFNSIASPRGRRKMVILGEMRELGEVSAKEHAKIISMLSEMNIDDVWLVGRCFKECNPPYRMFEDVNEVEDALRENPLSNRLILIKGSNSTRLYRLPEYIS